MTWLTSDGLLLTSRICDDAEVATNCKSAEPILEHRPMMQLMLYWRTVWRHEKWRASESLVQLERSHIRAASGARSACLPASQHTHTE